MSVSNLRLVLACVALTYCPLNDARAQAMFRGSADHLGVYESAAPTLRTVLWKFAVAGRIVSSPVVVGEAVYFGSSDGSLYAVGRADGSALEVHDGQRGPRVSGRIRRCRLHRQLGSQHVRTGRRHGQELWRFQTGEDTTIHNQVGIAGSAAVARGVVYFGCRDGHFYAVDARTGAQRWSHDNKMGWVIASPAIKDGVVYFPTSDGTRFKALNAETGALKYDLETKAISFSSPAIADNVIYFGSSDGWMHALDLATGAVKAEFQSDGSKANSATYLDEKGHFNSEAMYPDFTLDGMIIGVHNMFTLGSFLSSPVVANGILYVGSTDGSLYALK